MSGIKNLNNAANRRPALEQPIALYCRAARQSNHAIESQKEQLLRFVNQTGHTNYAWYIDSGEGGLTLDHPELNRLIADITEGKIAAVVVTDVSRIARGFYALTEWMRLMGSYGVRCYSVDSKDYDVE